VLDRKREDKGSEREFKREKERGPLDEELLQREKELEMFDEEPQQAERAIRECCFKAVCSACVCDLLAVAVENQS
jgi:hypothetical protein